MEFTVGYYEEVDVGYSEEVNWIWSIVKYILTHQRAVMTPVILELIISMLQYRFLGQVYHAAIIQTVRKDNQEEWLKHNLYHKKDEHVSWIVTDQ